LKNSATSSEKDSEKEKYYKSTSMDIKKLQKKLEEMGCWQGTIGKHSLAKGNKRKRLGKTVTGKHWNSNSYAKLGKSVKSFKKH
jgi:hypothetical protein